MRCVGADALLTRSQPRFHAGGCCLGMFTPMRVGGGVGEVVIYSHIGGTQQLAKTAGDWGEASLSREVSPTDAPHTAG